MTRPSLRTTAHTGAGPGTTRRLAGLLVALLAMLAAGCEMMPVNAPATQAAPVELPAVPDRLRAFYQELQSGRFEILADLEKPEQVQIFRIEGDGQARLTVQRSRVDTGAGALEVTLNDPQAALLVDDQQATAWALPRLWREHELLMLSAYAPSPAVVGLRIESGFEEPVAWHSEPIPLQKGWNILRIDLADVGRAVDLADVRQIRLQAQGDAWPVRFYLDDLVLADNTTTLYGDAKGPEGSLYVQRVGRRFHVGAAGRFELVFNRGLLTSWYDLSSDPDRQVDLAGAGPIGPVLTALSESGAPLESGGLESWAGLGRNVRTHLRLLEHNALYVTLRGTIEFGAGTGDAGEADEDLSQTVAGARPVDTQAAQTRPVEPDADGRRQQVYLYTIRADGRVFVDIDADVASPQFRPDRIGLVSTSLSKPFQLQQVDPLGPDLLERLRWGPSAASRPAEEKDVAADLIDPEQPAAGQPIPRGLLLSRARGEGSHLLLVPYEPWRYERVLCAVRQAGDSMACMYVMRSAEADHVQVSAMLTVWPPDLKDVATAAAVARDYQEPAAPQVEVGRLRTNSDGDRDRDGFAEGLGRWMLAPDGQVLRLRWPAGQLRFWPMLEVTGLNGKACWAYLDGRIIKPVERCDDGDAVFVVPEILSRAALLEVTTEP